MERAIEVLHTYTIEELLYARGVARGYRARDQQLDDPVVLEVVPRLDEAPERHDFDEPDLAGQLLLVPPR